MIVYNNFVQKLVVIAVLISIRQSVNKLEHKFKVSGYKKAGLGQKLWDLCNQVDKSNHEKTDKTKNDDICDLFKKVFYSWLDVKDLTQEKLLENCYEKKRKKNQKYGDNCMKLNKFMENFLKLLSLSNKKQLVKTDLLCKIYDKFSFKLNFCQESSENPAISSDLKPISSNKKLSNLKRFCLDNPNHQFCMKMFILGKAISQKHLQMAKSQGVSCIFCYLNWLEKYLRHCNPIAEDLDNKYKQFNLDDLSGNNLYLSCHNKWHKASRKLEKLRRSHILSYKRKIVSDPMGLRFRKVDYQITKDGWDRVKATKFWDLMLQHDFMNHPKNLLNENGSPNEVGVVINLMNHKEQNHKKDELADKEDLKLKSGDYQKVQKYENQKFEVPDESVKQIGHLGQHVKNELFGDQLEKWKIMTKIPYKEYVKKKNAGKRKQRKIEEKKAENIAKNANEMYIIRKKALERKHKRQIAKLKKRKKKLDAERKKAEELRIQGIVMKIRKEAEVKRTKESQKKLMKFKEERIRRKKIEVKKAIEAEAKLKKAKRKERLEKEALERKRKGVEKEFKGVEKVANVYEKKREVLHKKEKLSGYLKERLRLRQRTREDKEREERQKKEELEKDLEERKRRRVEAMRERRDKRRKERMEALKRDLEERRRRRENRILKRKKKMEMKNVEIEKADIEKKKAEVERKKNMIKIDQEKYDDEGYGEPEGVVVKENEIETKYGENIGEVDETIYHEESQGESLEETSPQSENQQEPYEETNQQSVNEEEETDQQTESEKEEIESKVPDQSTADKKPIKVSTIVSGMFDDIKEQTEQEQANNSFQNDQETPDKVPTTPSSHSKKFENASGKTQDAINSLIGEVEGKEIDDDDLEDDMYDDFTNIDMSGSTSQEKVSENTQNAQKDGENPEVEGTEGPQKDKNTGEVENLEKGKDMGQGDSGGENEKEGKEIPKEFWDDLLDNSIG